MTETPHEISSRLSPLRDKIINPATRGLRPRFARNQIRQNMGTDNQSTVHSEQFELINSEDSRNRKIALTKCALYNTFVCSIAMAECRFSTLVDDACGDNHFKETHCVTIQSCQREVQSHLGELHAINKSLPVSEKQLILARAGDITYTVKFRPSYKPPWL